MSKEMRRERNRITARESRDRKAAYIVQLEAEVRQLNERIAQLEYDMAKGGGGSDHHANSTHNTFFSMYSADDTSMLSSSSSLLMASPEHMGFFDP
jgi:hypothetical protein